MSDTKTFVYYYDVTTAVPYSPIHTELCDNEMRLLVVCL